MAMYYADCVLRICSIVPVPTADPNAPKPEGNELTPVPGEQLVVSHNQHSNFIVTVSSSYLSYCDYGKTQNSISSLFDDFSGTWCFNGMKMSSKNFLIFNKLIIFLTIWLSEIAINRLASQAPSKFNTSLCLPTALSCRDLHGVLFKAALDPTDQPTHCCMYFT